MRKLIMVALAVVALSLGCSVSEAGVSKHALPKVARAAVKAVVVAPKATLVALKNTVGSVLFAGEAVVDVVHAGTTALNAVAAKELKHNPFEYIDGYVGKADAGLEKAYLFFFNASI